MPHLSLGVKTVMWPVSQINGWMARLWVIITTNVSLLSLNALRVVEIIWKATSIVTTCSVSPPKVYQTPWRLWTTQIEAACNRRSLTFNDGAGHTIVLLRKGRSSLPLKISQGSIPAPGNPEQKATGLLQPEEELLPGGAVSMTGEADQICLFTLRWRHLWEHRHKAQAPDSTPCDVAKSQPVKSLHVHFKRNATWVLF